MKDKQNRNLIIFDKVLTVLALLLFGLFRPDFVVIAAYVFLIPYLILTKRKVLFYPFLVASALAVIWSIAGRDMYGYNREVIVMFGINFFPLFAWATGLFAIYLVYSHYEHLLKYKSYIKQLLLFLAFYWPLLIAGETIAFHVFNFKNLATAAYVGLPLCDCLHAPHWMQAVYLLMGPLFFTMCYLLKLENPDSNLNKK